MSDKPATKKREPAKYPETLTAEEIGELAGLTGRRIQQLAEDGALTKNASGRFPGKAAIKALIAYYREQANGLPAQTAADRARQAKADADSAQLKAAKDLGILMFKTDAKRLWADGLVKIREVILRSGLPTKKQKEITDALQRIKLPED